MFNTQLTKIKHVNNIYGFSSAVMFKTMKIVIQRDEFMKSISTILRDKAMRLSGITSIELILHAKL